MKVTEIYCHILNVFACTQKKKVFFFCWFFLKNARLIALEIFEKTFKFYSTKHWISLACSYFTFFDRFFKSLSSALN